MDEKYLPHFDEDSNMTYKERDLLTLIQDTHNWKLAFSHGISKCNKEGSDVNTYTRI